MNNKANGLNQLIQSIIVVFNNRKMINVEKKIEKELKDCSFNPKKTKMPNFAYSQYEDETTELYYMRKKNGRKLSQDKSGRINYAKNYDKRKKKISCIKSASANNIETEYYPKQINLLPPQELLNKDDDFEAQKNALKQNLHGLNYINSEEDDDFFKYY